MGIQPRPLEFGTDCPVCFPSGKTPKYVKCFFSGIKMGDQWHSGLPLPPNGYFDLEADPVRYCIWVISQPGPWAIEWKLFDTYSSLLCWTQSIHAFYHKRNGELCENHFVNSHTIPGPYHYYGGSAYITIPGNLEGDDDYSDPTLSGIVNSVTPIIDPDPRMECFPMEGELIVVRYAGKRDATNIKIKVDTNP